MALRHASSCIRHLSSLKGWRGFARLPKSHPRLDTWRLSDLRKQSSKHVDRGEPGQARLTSQVTSFVAFTGSLAEKTCPSAAFCRLIPRAIPATLPRGSQGILANPRIRGMQFQSGWRTGRNRNQSSEWGPLFTLYLLGLGIHEPRATCSGLVVHSMASSGFLKAFVPCFAWLSPASFVSEEPPLHHDGFVGHGKDGPSVASISPQGLRSSSDGSAQVASMAASVEKPQKDVPKTQVASLPEVAAPHKPEAPRQRASPAPAFTVTGIYGRMALRGGTARPGGQPRGIQPDRVGEQQLQTVPAEGGPLRSFCR
eukprot:s4041_g2.t1